MILSQRIFIFLLICWLLLTAFWVWEYYEGGLESIWHLLTVFILSAVLFFLKAQPNVRYFFICFIGAWFVSSLSLKIYNYGYTVFSGIELGEVSLIGYFSAGPFTPNFWMVLMAAIIFRVTKR